MCRYAFLIANCNKTSKLIKFAKKKRKFLSQKKLNSFFHFTSKMCSTLVDRSLHMKYEN